MSGREEVDQASLGWLSGVSLMSGGSLVLFGFVSLLLSLFGGGLAGVLVGAALLVHGIVELQARSAVLQRSDMRGGRRLCINQLVLAVSISAYAGSQVFNLNDEAIGQAVAKALESPLVKSFLDIVPVEALDQVVDQMPGMVRGLYVAVVVVAWLGCGLTALYYRSKVRVIVV
tara:strand:+ start:214 stop:732 length:519 start_codon:yes stop_codon:yes gene_type:complete